MEDLSRRKMIKLGLLSSVTALLVSCGENSKARIATPAEIEGPFYPLSGQADQDSDLTETAGYHGVADGQHIIVQGQILDTEGCFIENAMIDIWQANSSGRYHHPNDTNPAPLDPGFQGRAIIQSGKNGAFRFKTVMPGAYPVSETWIRPPHIHFKVSRKDYLTLTTQMYFPDEKLNEADLLFSKKKASEQLLMTAESGDKEELAVYRYNIILERQS